MSYAKKVDLSISGVVTSPDVDAKAATALEQSAKSGGRISGAELQKAVLPLIDDYKGYVGQAERPLVRALQAASTNKDVTINGHTVRLTEPAKRFLDVWSAQVQPLTPVGYLSEASFNTAVGAALRAWYATEVERVIADIDAFDPETAADYSPAQRAEDRARAQDPQSFLPAGQSHAFAFRPDENLNWLLLGDDADLDFPLTNAAGNKVARGAIAFMELNYDPIYAGQQLTSWFAFDKRNGELLKFFETQA